MEVPMMLDHHLILNGQPKEIAHHLRVALKRSSSGEINTWLLEAVEAEALPPSVFGVWLRMAEPESVAVAFHQAFSSVVRASAIHQFCKLLASNGRNPSTIWETFGGTEGLLTALASFSVLHVKLFCKTLGGTGIKQTAREERQPLVTELFKGLTHQYHFSVQLKTTDPRPLLDHYLQLLPACNDEMAVAWREASTADPGKLQSAHTGAFELQLMDSIRGSKDDVLSWYSPLLLKCEDSVKVAIQTVHWLNTIDINPSSKMHGTFSRHLALPLLQKLGRRRVPISLFTEVLDSMLRFFERNPTSTSALDLDFLSPIVERWSRFEAELTPRIESFLRGAASNMTVPSRLEPLLPLLRKVGIWKRYHLLQVLLRGLAEFQFDIDTMEGRRRPRLPVNLFLELPRQQGRILFNKFGNMDGPLNHHRSPFSAPVAVKTSSMLLNGTAETILMVELIVSRGEAGAEDYARSVIEKRQKQAMEARESDERARYAMEATRFAIASGSPELLEEVIVWCRRFNRDWEVVEALYSDENEIFVSRECVDLLCGVPDLDRDRLETIRQGVEKGDRICLLLLETATMVLPEPSFSPNDWEGVTKVFSRVVDLRLKRTAKLCARQRFTPEQLFDGIWTSTIDTCLELERIGLKPDNEGLRFHFARGPLVYSTYTGPRFSDLDPSSLKFVDELSKKRDELWTQYRSTHDPPSSVLSHPFPQGLPTQHLFPILADPARKDRGFDIPPYLASRIKQVVYIDPKIALRRGPPVDVIGPFKDDWSELLKVFIASFPFKARKAEVQRVWTYATTKLNSGRLNQEVNLFCWSKAFAKAKLDVGKLLNIDIPRREHGPTVPSGQPSFRTEWNPAEKAAKVVRMINMPLENIDLMLDITTDELITKDSYFSVEDKLAVENVHEWFFQFLPTKLSSEPGLVPQEEEGLIAAALLLLGKRGQHTSNGFSGPFPSVATRFPALYLTAPFVKDHTRQEISAVRALRRYSKLKRTPSRLLSWLVQGLFASLKESESAAALTQILFPVIQVLSQSDKAHLALDVVGQVVVARPEESSWHRHIMTKRFLSRLSARHAEEFFAGVIAAVQTRLGNRSKEQRDEEPAIKISTLKLIVELLVKSKVVSEAFAVDALVGILASSKHIDVRAAVVKAWIDLLVSTIPLPSSEPTQAQGEIREQILSTLETQAIPVAASLNERYPKADGMLSRGELPEAYRPSNEAVVPPILDTLLDAVNLFEADFSLKKAFVKRILEPTLRQSSTVNRQFLETFATKHKLDLPISPPIPAKPRSLTRFMTQHLDITSSDLLDMWAEYVLFHLQMDESRNVLEPTAQDPAVRGTNPEQHFLDIQGCIGHSKVTVVFGGVNLAKAAADGFQTKLRENGITGAQILRIFYELADAVIQKDTPEGSKWESLTNALALLMTKDSKITAKWLQNARPIVEELVNKVENIRSSPEWQQNPNRSPSVLPDTLLLRLWLLPFPHVAWPPERDFGGEVKGLLREMTDGNRPYISRLERLKQTLRSLPRDILVQAALFLGVLGADVASGSRLPSLVEHLCAELASSLLQARPIWPEDDVVKQEARSMVEGWQTSFDEELRRKGLVLKKALQNDRSLEGMWD